MNSLTSRFLALAALVAANVGSAQILITNNASAAGQNSYDFGPVVVSAYVGADALTPNAPINSANLSYIGVNAIGNVNAINDGDGVYGGADQERLELKLDSNFGLSDLRWDYSRADGPLATDGVSISGFLADPGVSFTGGTVGTPYYSAGTLNFQISAASGYSSTIQTVSFSNLAASDGATLSIVVADSTQAGAQFALHNFTVASVPEPSSIALIGLGLAVLLGRRRHVS